MCRFLRLDLLDQFGNLLKLDLDVNVYRVAHQPFHGATFEIISSCESFLLLYGIFAWRRGLRTADRIVKCQHLIDPTKPVLGLLVCDNVYLLRVIPRIFRRSLSSDLRYLLASGLDRVQQSIADLPGLHLFPESSP